MSKCAIEGCNNRNGRYKPLDVSFFKVPSVIKNQCPNALKLSEKRRHFWLRIIGKKGLDFKNANRFNSTVCGKHFVGGMPSKLFDMENVDWVPTLHLGQVKNETHINTPVHQNTRLRKRLCIMENSLEDTRPFSVYEDQHVEVILKPLLESANVIQEIIEVKKLNDKSRDFIVNEVDIPIMVDMKLVKSEKIVCENEIIRNFEDVGCQTEFTETNNAECQTETRKSRDVESQTDISAKDLVALENDNIRMNNKLYRLREKIIKSEFAEKTFDDNDKKVNLYTGLLTFERMKNILSFNTKLISHSNCNKLFEPIATSSAETLAQCVVNNQERLNQLLELIQNEMVAQREQNEQFSLAISSHLDKSNKILVAIRNALVPAEKEIDNFVKVIAPLSPNNNTET